MCDDVRVLLCDRAAHGGRRAVPDDYSVLFLQGGATTVFASVAMNLMRHGNGAPHAGYIVSGGWSKKAAAEVCLLSWARSNVCLRLAGRKVWEGVGSI